MGRLAEHEAHIRAEGADVEIPARALAGEPRHIVEDGTTRLEHDLAETIVANRALKRKQAELAQALALARGDIAALRQSISWRVTAPLRAAAAAYRSLRQRVRRLWRHPADSSPGIAPPPAAQAVDLNIQARFDHDGFLVPVDLLTRAQCRLICRHFRRSRWPAWVADKKGYAVHDRLFYDVATRPALLAMLRSLLGEDIVLWGAKIIKRLPGQKHPWHTDIESSAPDGRFVSVWIGLENTSQASALHLISRSHKFGKPIQRVAQERGVARDDIARHTAAWAREFDTEAAILQPKLRDGQAIVFDGRLWHGSLNATDRTRLALLLQYAASDQAIALTDGKYSDWPFRYSEAPKGGSRIVYCAARRPS